MPTMLPLRESTAREATVRFRVPVAREAVEGARRRVREVLAEWGISEREDLSYDIQLVLSELLSNAIVHGSGPLSVAVQRDNDLFIVEVFDAHRDMPVESVPGPDDESKRGLAVVKAVAYSHGCERYPRGKRCWAVLRGR
ncbi:ATP-binding protein [Streptomyces sp. NPDC051976]|uniref:ATP-binding protein n=1 Tax=Streptomyces sp. NPDC051976 TaxID=3154947 RepID=UPI003446B4B0